MDQDDARRESPYGIPIVSTAAGTRQVVTDIPRWAVIGIFFFLLIAGLAYARWFLVPVLTSFLLMLVFSPPRRALDRIGLPSGLSAAVIVLALMAGLFVLGVFLAAPLSEWIENAPSVARTVEWKLRAIMQPMEDLGEMAAQVEDATDGGASEGDEEVQEVVLREQGLMSKLAFMAPNLAAQLVFALVLLFFLLAAGNTFYAKIIEAMPTWRDKRRALAIAFDIERNLSRYLFSITMINAGLGVAIGLSFWAVGMTDPLLFGVIAFLFNFLPYIGAIGGTALAGISGLVAAPGYDMGLIAAGIYFTLTTIEGNLVTPPLVGRRLELNPVVIFVSVAFWAWLWSFMGVLMAVPLLISIRTFCEHVPALQPVATFLSTRSELAESASAEAADGALRHGREAGG